MEPCTKRLARHVRAERNIRKWSEASLAERAGLTAERIRRIEAGKDGATLADLDALAQAFGLQPEHLIRGGP